MSTITSSANGAKKAKLAAESSCPILLDQTDIWVQNILPYVGGGNFIFLALVSKRFKELYEKYIAAIEDPPMVKEIVSFIADGIRVPNYNEFQLSDVCTLYSSVVSEVSLAQYWHKLTMHKNLCENYKATVMLHAVKNGNLEVIQFYHGKGFPMNEETCRDAAMFGHLNVLKWLHENNCPWDAQTCAAAAFKGDLNCLKYARDKGCPWDTSTCTQAAGQGHLDILMWAHDNQCPWDPSGCATLMAALGGHLSCLKYAHENGCPWSVHVWGFAAQNGHLECLKYAHNNRCPRTLQAGQYLSLHAHIREWAANNNLV